MTASFAVNVGRVLKHLASICVVRKPDQITLSLLEADSEEGRTSFLKNTLAIPVARITEKPGDRIGRYKLFPQLGEGGCGVV